jgi:hypothetical protein
MANLSIKLTGEGKTGQAKTRGRNETDDWIEPDPFVDRSKLIGGK